MVGLGISCSSRDTSILLRRPCAFSSRLVSADSRPSAIALTSPPAQNPRPAPVSTITPTAASAASRGSASSSASSIGPDSALSRSGRLRVSTATPSFTLSSRSLVMIASAKCRYRTPRQGPVRAGAVWHRPMSARRHDGCETARQAPDFIGAEPWHPTCPKRAGSRGRTEDGIADANGLAPAALARRHRLHARARDVCRSREAARDRDVFRESPRSLAGLRRSAVRPRRRAHPRVLDALPPAVRALRRARAADLHGGDARRLRAAGRALVQSPRLDGDGLGGHRRRAGGVVAERVLATALAVVPRSDGARLEGHPGLRRADGDQSRSLRDDSEASRSNPGRIALLNAFSTSRTSTCHVLVCGLSSRPEMSAFVATSFRGRFLRIFAATSSAFSFTFWPKVLSSSLSLP